MLGPALIAVCMMAGGCGYRVRPAAGKLPGGIASLGIPALVNMSPQFKVEQKVTAALRKEFMLRTRIPISARTEGVDAILQGEIRSVSASPVAFPSDTFGSAFLVTIQMGVKLVRSKDASVIWDDPSFLFRERYVLNSRVQDFFSEENPAIDRLAREFASSLVSTILKP